jgi:pimeloyl-ACP methyl ester carboxylesterase/DNA-binding response OmpR family regulator
MNAAETQMQEPVLGPATAPAADPGLSHQQIRHELRTPVNHIIGYSEMLLEEAAELAQPEPFGQLHEVVAIGKQLLSIISELLDQPDSPSSSAISALHTHLQPHLDAILSICADLELIVHGHALDHFAPDLHRIITATNQLAILSARVSGHEQIYTHAQSEQPALTPTGEPRSSVAGAHLLLVDDHPLNRDMLGRRLERLGYRVTQAEHGKQALELLEQSPVDLILLDIMMPELDGYGVLEALKRNPALRHIPVIILSALDDMQNIVRGIELGADDYLPKPFDPVLLRARIDACLVKKHIHDLESSYVKQVEAAKRRTDDLLHVVIPIGVALSGEKDFNQLLERIVTEAQKLCNADGGTLYLRTDDERLRFVIVRSRSLQIAMGGASGKDIPFAPLRLYDEATGAPQNNYVVAHTALSGQTINIADAYNADGYDFSGTREFDARTGYRSTSLLNIPLQDGSGRVIGVLQLINAQQADGAVVAFNAEDEQMLQSLGRLAAAALAAYAREHALRQEIADLKIAIDQVKKQREVREITSSSYFNQLQEQARELRGNREAGTPRRGTSTRSGETQAEKKIFMVHGQPIHARVQGTPGRRLIVLIHGWSSSWYALSPLLPLLSERFYCVAVDLPGYGDSPALPGRTTIPAYADLLAGLVQQLSPAVPAVLLGHSMGGMISLTMALRHPEVVERLILLCPTISGNLSFWINAFIAPITMIERVPLFNRIVATLEPYLLSATDRLMKPASFAERTKITEAEYHRLRADARRPGQGRVRADCYTAMRNNDLRGQLRQITMPALVIWGMEDNTVPLRDASAVVDEWPSAELRVLPKAGHWPQFETPDVTWRNIRAFVSKPLKLLKADFLMPTEREHQP